MKLYLVNLPEEYVMFPTLINKLSSALQLSFPKRRHSLLWISSIETGSPSRDRKLAPDIVVDVDMVVLVGIEASMSSLVDEPNILFVVGNDVSIFIGEVIDEADIAADNELLDLWAEHTDWFLFLAEDNFAIHVVDILPI